MNLFKIHEHVIILARQNIWNTPATTNFFRPEILADSLEINSELNRKKEYEIIGADYVENSKFFEIGVGENNLYRIKIKFRPTLQNLSLILNFTPKERTISSTLFNFGLTPHKINYHSNEGRFLTLIAKTQNNIFERYYNGVSDNYSLEYDFKTKEFNLTAEFVFTKKDTITSLPNSTLLGGSPLTLTNYDTVPLEQILLNKISINENFNFEFDEVFLIYKRTAAIEIFSSYIPPDEFSDINLYFGNNFTSNLRELVKKEPAILNDYLFSKITFANVTYNMPAINNI